MARLEVVDSGRRRRWSDEEKLKIVLESLAVPRQVSATARRYGIARSQLLQWRRLFRPERAETAEQPTGFVPAVVVPDREAAPSTLAEDVGGPWRYREFIEALDDPNHERHAEMRQWFGEDFNPHFLAAEIMAARVAALAKRWSRKPAARKKRTS